MAVYIEKSVAIDVMRSFAEECKRYCVNPDQVRGAIFAANELNKVPAANVVEVVHCAECRFQDTCKRTIEIVPRQAQIGYLRGVVHFCEYGERRVGRG